MPRIKAALALVAVGVFCIGFNTMRYRAVWEMVATVSPSPGADPAGAMIAAGPAAKPAGGPTLDSVKPPAAAISATAAGKDPNGISSKKPEKSPSKTPEDLGASRPKSDSVAKKSSSSSPKPGEAPKSSPAKPPKSDGAKAKKPASSGKPSDASLQKSKDEKPRQDSEPPQSTLAKSDSGLSEDYGVSTAGAGEPWNGERREKKESEATGGSDRPICTGGSCRLPGSFTSDERSFANSESPRPIEMAPEPKYGSSAGYSSPGYSGGQSHDVGETASSSPMVPVVRPSTPGEGEGTASGWGNAAPRNEKDVRRLPPADQTAASLMDASTVLPDGSVPVYPVTQTK